MFPASESLLSKLGLAIAAPGCISATGEHEPRRYPRTFRALEHRGGGQRRQRADALRKIFQAPTDDSGDEASRRGIRARAGLARSSGPR